MCLSLVVLEHDPATGRGGQELSLVDLCQRLASRGHSIHLLHTADGNLLPRYRSFCKSVTKAGPYEINRRSPASASIGFARSLLAGRRTGASIVYCNQYLDSFFAAALARVMHVPLICHLRLPPPNQFCGQWRLGLRSVTRFIAVSQATASQFAEAGFDPASISVVYNGIDVDDYSWGDDRESTRRELGIPEADYIVMFAGRMSSVKNHSLLIRAFAALLNSVPQSGLLMVGDTGESAQATEASTYVRELRSLAASLGVASRLKWLGKRSDLPSLYRAADVVVLPSSFQEPFGRVLIEAMACGTPAIGTAVGGIPEILSGEFADNCVNPGDFRDLAARLVILRDWPKRDPGLSARCREHVKAGFALERTISGVDKVLQEVAGIGPARLGPDAGVLRKWSGHYS